MERKKNGQELKSERSVLSFLKALLCSYVVTGILLLVLTLLLYKLNLDEGKVTMGIMVIYVASTFAGGMVIGKLVKERKFLWGLVLGVVYFALLLLISLAVYRTLQAGGSSVISTLLLCAGGGMLGGMLS